jgi:hypothetical protein
MIAHAPAAATAQKESPASVDALNRADAQRAPHYAHAAAPSAPSQARTARAPLNRDRLDEAKRRVPLSVAARNLGLSELLRPNGVQRSPLREDRNASFSVTGDTLWHDFATGDGGDVVDFIALATSCDRGSAIRRVIEWAGLADGSPLPPVRLVAPQPAPRREPRDRLRGLDLREPTVGELAEIRNQRGWSVFAGLEIASRRGLLRIANVPHGSALVLSWILTDSARKTAWARRLDGKPWQFAHAESKANALRSDPDHPPGLADVISADRRAVVVAEGEPDCMAALTLAWASGAADRIGVICLTGAARPLSASVCAALVGRRVRILRQFDPPGPDGKRPSHRAAAEWTRSLTEAGVAADCLSLDALPVKDLADLIRDVERDELQLIAAAVLRGLLP